jgi:hypothetical protein
MPTLSFLRGAAVLAVALLIAACQAKPMPFPVPASELDNRPGLLTGKSGEAVIFSR